MISHIFLGDPLQEQLYDETELLKHAKYFAEIGPRLQDDSVGLLVSLRTRI